VLGLGLDGFGQGVVDHALCGLTVVSLEARTHRFDGFGHGKFLSVLGCGWNRNGHMWGLAPGITGLKNHLTLDLTGNQTRLGEAGRIVIWPALA
jgi:hypothetical protein